jgi:succinylarginine dihydrolase
MKYYEVNFDCLPGPTHLYGGLSKGNFASAASKDLISNPKQAALQSLDKMKFLHDLGYKQAVLPPHDRPNYELLKNFGFRGSNLELIKAALTQEPELLKSALSSSFMWAANAATVSPSFDTEDSTAYMTIANLKTNFHRAAEAFQTYKIFRSIFENTGIKICPPLPTTAGDEGAANHIRFALDHGSKGVELFVYGYSLELNLALPELYPARQCLEASMAIIEAHKLKEAHTVLAQQNPEAVDAGVFHNDVISTGNLNFFLCHELAFVNQHEVMEELKDKFKDTAGKDLILKQVTELEIELSSAVVSYLFNSQILGDKDKMMILAPIECKENPRIHSYLEKLVREDDNPIQELNFIDLKQSMLNGGGPACLRIRVVLNEEQLKKTNQKMMFSNDLYQKLKKSIETYYPEKFELSSISNASMLEQIENAYIDLQSILPIKDLDLAR